MARNNWGLISLIALLVAFAVQPLCTRLFHDAENFCLLPVILVLGLAFGFSIAAIRRGSKWWLLVSVLSLFGIGQVILALSVE